jgi:CBS domain-containing protein
MRVEDIMSRDPVFCSPGTNLREVAEKMVEFDCGEIPICDGAGKPIGVITDRDIVCRVIAKGHDPLASRAEEYMSDPVVTTTPDASLDDCVRLMEQYQVRRLPVVDSGGVCCGMVAQADVARHANRDTIAEVMEHVSEPNTFASSVGTTR